ncbi:MAG: lipid-binding SYLF domain-containing protein [Phycisphaerae bacterium]|nr:lipid-binding SYLF domain-containing protein [Phycisphaerae bacterium]
MLTRLIVIALAAITVSAGGCGNTSMSSRILKDTAILESMQASSKPIPAATLKNASGVAIINEIEAGVGIGGSGGEGILVRKIDGGWSQPLAVSIASGTIGVQLGAQGTDMVIVFNTDAAVMKFASEGASMIAVAKGTAGGASGGTAAMSGPPPTTQIFSRSEGLYGGADVGGFNVQVDKKVNEETYGTSTTVLQILEGRAAPQPGMMRIERMLDGGK